MNPPAILKCLVKISPMTKPHRSRKSQECSGRNIVGVLMVFLKRLICVQSQWAECAEIIFYDSTATPRVILSPSHRQCNFCHKTWGKSPMSILLPLASRVKWLHCRFSSNLFGAWVHNMAFLFFLVLRHRVIRGSIASLGHICSPSKTQRRRDSPLHSPITSTSHGYI